MRTREYFAIYFLAASLPMSKYTKIYHHISLYIDLLHYICEKELDNFTFLHYPSKGGRSEMLLIKLLGA